MRTLILILLLIPFIGVSQKSDKFKFKKVSKELLSETEHAYVKEAIAAYDQNRCEVTYSYNSLTGFICNQKFTQRIKIYKEDGKKYGDFEIELYKRNTTVKEQITGFEAYTFNLVDGEIKKTKLLKKDTYETEVNKNVSTFSFAMPDVQIGSVIEITYVFETPFYFNLDPFYMQRYVPVNNMSYSAVFPEYFAYNPITKGVIKINQERKDGRKSLYLNDSSEKLEFRSDEWKFEGKNILPIQEEPYVHNMANYLTSISWELRSTNFPGSFIKNYNTSWNDVATTLQESDDFGKFLKASNRELKNVINTLEGKSDEEKIQSLYEYVSLNFKWNNRYSKYGGNMMKLLKEKSGNSGQLNLLLINLIRQAGIEIYPVALKTKNRGYLNISYPTLGELNYVIGAIPTSKGYIFLDATTPLLPIGYLPYRALNLNGVLINENVGTKIDIKSPNKVINTDYVKASLSADNKLTGSLTSQYSKYSGYSERKQVASFDDEAAYFASLNEDEDFLCTNEKIENFDDFDKPLKVIMDVDYTNQLQEIDDKIFIPTLLNLGLEENPYRSDTRRFNLNYNTTFNSRTIVNYTIPENYSVESKPDDITMSLPDESITYRFKITTTNNTINITSFITRKNDNISYEMYGGIREIYEEILKKSSEQIVLVKN